MIKKKFKEIVNSVTKLHYMVLAVDKTVYVKSLLKQISVHVWLMLLVLSVNI